MVKESKMLIPTAVEKLGEPDTALCHATGQQAVVCVSAGSARFWAVEFKNPIGFIGKIRELWSRSLHAERHLVLADAC